jgi:hypothetical protein
MRHPMTSLVVAQVQGHWILIDTVISCNQNIIYVIIELYNHVRIDENMSPQAQLV